MNWQQVCEDPNLKDLPYRVELDAQGKVIMSPAKNKHALYQGRIERVLWKYIQGGEVYPECPIETSNGTKAADVVWMSEERIAITEEETSCSIAPEICVEVLSSSNTSQEMEEKKKLYFEKQAQEVWICKNGNLEFFNAKGKLKKSKLLPDFPEQITKVNSYLTELQEALFNARKERKAKELALQKEKEARKGEKEAKVKADRYLKLLLERGIDPSKLN